MAGKRPGVCSFDQPTLRRRLQSRGPRCFRDLGLTVGERSDPAPRNHFRFLHETVLGDANNGLYSGPRFQHASLNETEFGEHVNDSDLRRSIPGHSPRLCGAGLPLSIPLGPRACRHVLI